MSAIHYIFYWRKHVAKIFKTIDRKLNLAQCFSKLRVVFQFIMMLSIFSITCIIAVSVLQSPTVYIANIGRDVFPLSFIDYYEQNMNPNISVGGEVKEEPTQFLRGYNKSIEYIHYLKYIINEPYFCNQSSDMEIITYIHSSFSKIENRQLIRESWGSPKYYNYTKLRVIFVFGAATSKIQQDEIVAESKKYRDIIQTDFVDTYRNLSYKGVSALKWISEYCPQPNWILKSDDDMIINTIALLPYLHKVEKDHRHQYERQIKELNDNYHLDLSKPKSFNVRILDKNNKAVSAIQLPKISKFYDKIMCAVWDGMPVLRGQPYHCAKWCVDESHWPYDYFPNYCSGSAFIVPRHLAPKLYKAYFKSRFLWVDDAYVTGVLAKIAGVGHRAIHSLYQLDHYKIKKDLIHGNRLFCHHPGNAEDRTKWWPLIAEKEGLT